MGISFWPNIVDGTENGGRSEAEEAPVFQLMKKGKVKLRDPGEQ